MEDNSSSGIGVFIDIDGVVLQGGRRFEWSKDSIHRLWDNKIPFMFVTNGTYASETLLSILKKELELPFNANHIVVAPSPCLSLKQYHDKHVLVCCQDDSIDLIKELGFNNYLTVEQLASLFPELDYVDHKKRKHLLKNPPTPEHKRLQEEFEPIDVILLLGEPINWECSLQLLIDVLMTNGDPRIKFKYMPNTQLPIIACNKDLTFKGAANLPRFGHGAFLECLEILYNKITKNDLVYEVLMGKPYLVTYEFAANQIQNLAFDNKKIDKFFIIGDNPDVDIRGANSFKECLSKNLKKKELVNHKKIQIVIQDDDEEEQNNQVESILVCTGVYNPQNDLRVHLKHLFDSNGNEASQKTKLDNDTNNNLVELEKSELKDALSRRNSFISYFDNKLNIPDLTVDNLSDAVDYIIRFKNENN